LHTLQCASDVARRLGVSVNLARAALLSEETTWNGNLSTTSVVPLLGRLYHVSCRGLRFSSRYCSCRHIIPTPAALCWTHRRRGW
jgi:hypothetical protein